MKVLITGANGGFAKTFIPVAKVFFSDIFLTARLPLDIANYIQCDLSDITQVKSLLTYIQPNYIFHLAGSYSGSFATDMHANVICTQQLLDVLLNEKINCRTILLGSAAEYGHVLPEHNPISEQYPVNPISHYGFTKVTQTNLAMYYSKVKGLDILVARIFNLMSKGLSQKLFIGKVEKLILEYKSGSINKIVVGNLDAERDYIDSVEAAKQIILLAINGISGNIYNIGSGKSISMRDILIKMLHDEGLNMDCVFEDRNLSSSKEIGVSKIYANTEKTTNLIRTLKVLC